MLNSKSARTRREQHQRLRETLVLAKASLGQLTTLAAKHNMSHLPEFIGASVAYQSARNCLEEVPPCN